MCHSEWCGNSFFSNFRAAQDGTPFTILRGAYPPIFNCLTLNTMRNIFLILFLLTAGVFINKSSAQAVILKADTVEVSCAATDTFLVPITIGNFTNVSGLQFTLKWDTARLDFAYVTMLNPDFQGVGFDTLPATIEQGILTFAWTDLVGLSFPTDTILFKVAFLRIGGAQTPISFVDDPTAVLVFNNQFDEIPHETFPGAVKPIDDEAPSVTCPANVAAISSGPVAIPNIPPVLTDNCGIPAAGWASVGASMGNFPTDPDASNAVFNIGSSTVTYTSTDVGGNTATCSFNVAVEFGISSSDLTLVANSSVSAACGESIIIDVFAFNFDSIAGLQFSMEWLPVFLEFTSISNLNVPLNLLASNFNEDSTGVGLLSFAWTSAGIFGASVPDNELLFSLTFNVLGSGSVNFGNNPTAQVAFTGTVFPPEEIPFETFGTDITIIDNEFPVLTCPADITVQGLGATAVSGIAPLSVTDNCAAPNVGWSVTGATSGNFPNDPDASGALFNIGNNVVTYTATDASGNASTCSFQVTVEFGIMTTDLVIIANSASASCGGDFTVNISALNFETIAGVQFTIQWDTALFQYNSVDNLNLPLGIVISNIGVDSVGVGYITFGWTSGDLNGLTINDGDILFSLNFTNIGNMPGNIQFGDDPTIRVAFDGGTFDQIDMLTVDGLVSIEDTEPPTIVCPMPAPVDAAQGQLTAAVTGLQPVVSDNCGGIPTYSYTQSGAGSNSGVGNADGVYNAGTTTVVYTAEDANGNTATCSFQVVVNADNPVILQLDTVDLGCQGAPTTVTVNLTVQNFVNIIGLQFGLEWDPAVLELVMPVPVHYLTQGPFPIFVNQNAGTLSFFGGHPGWVDVPNGDSILTLTFNVLDVNGLAATFLSFLAPFDALDVNFNPVAVQTINGAFTFTLDNVPPTITCPSDTVLMAPALACQVLHTVAAAVATDDCGGIASLTFSPPLGVFTVATPRVITYTATDDAGNTATCTFMVSVADVTPPVVSNCPTNPIVVNADQNCQGTATWMLPTFADLCDTMVTVMPDYLPGSLFTLGTTLVNITATDGSNNTSTCSFEVEVRDVTPPTIVCPADTVIVPLSGCTAVVNFVEPVPTDNCDMTLNVICSSISGSVFSGITTVTCAVLDDAGNLASCNFTITIPDTLAPTFPNGCPADITVVSASGNCGANPTWADPQVMDNCLQSPTLVSVPPSGTFFAAQVDPYLVIYTATDDLGNSVTCTFNVTVTDATPPVLTNCPTAPVLVVLPVDSCTVTLTWTNPTVSDNCAGVTLTSNLQPGVYPTGDTMVVFTATDAFGNTSTCSFNISVKDVVPPTFGNNCPTSPFVVPNGDPCGMVVDWTFPIGTDNCTPQDELVYQATYDTLSIFPLGTTVFPVRVTDASGNFIECDITVILQGQTPTFVNVPSNIVVNDCASVVSWVAPDAVGFCPPTIITVSPLMPGDVFPFGTTTITYLAVDSLGNTATATFNVTISESIAPVFNCPVSPILVNVGGVILSDPSEFLNSAAATANCDGVLLTYDLPNATDNCVTPTVSLIQGMPTGAQFGLGFNELVFRAVDPSGNLAQCAIFIEVIALSPLAPIVDPIPGCDREVITITAQNIPGATYNWTGPVSSGTNVVTINSLNSQNDGLYIVSATINGCSTPPDSAIVYLVMQPTAMNDLNFTIDPGQTIAFPSVFDNDVFSPAFDFSMCDTTALSGLMVNPFDGTFTYTAGDSPGMVSFIYTICSRTCDLESQAAVTITINDTKCAFIPNIITPNGDNMNDFFTIPCLETGLFRENSLIVYGQWGDKVYEASPYSNDPTEAWGGTLNGEAGKDLPDGVYFYIFKAGPTIKPMKGFVEVFR